MIRDLAATIIAVVLATGLSMEMNRLHPMQHGIAPQKLLISSHQATRHAVKPPGQTAVRKSQRLKTNSLSSATMPPLSASLQMCHYQVILGCFSRRAAAHKRLVRIGGRHAGGSAGLTVINTRNMPDLREGYYCVAGGPYPTMEYATSIAGRASVIHTHIRKECSKGGSATVKNKTGNLPAFALYQSP